MSMTAEEIWKSVEGIGSWMYWGDIEIYYRYLKMLNAGAKVVDVGTGRGESAMAMALSNPLVSVESYDDGSTMLYNRWAEDEASYLDKLNKQCQERGISNIQFVFKDFIQVDFGEEPTIDLFHLDDEEEEGLMLEYIISHVKVGGYLLVRNYGRFKEIVDNVCKDYEHLDDGGLIRVFRKK